MVTGLQRQAAVQQLSHSLSNFARQNAYGPSTKYRISTSIRIARPKQSLPYGCMSAFQKIVPTQPERTSAGRRQCASAIYQTVAVLLALAHEFDMPALTLRLKSMLLPPVDYPEATQAPAHHPT